MQNQDRYALGEARSLENGMKNRLAEQRAVLAAHSKALGERRSLIGALHSLTGKQSF